jgi:hypothetical protein
MSEPLVRTPHGRSAPSTIGLLIATEQHLLLNASSTRSGGTRIEIRGLGQCS